MVDLKTACSSSAGQKEAASGDINEISQTQQSSPNSLNSALIALNLDESDNQAPEKSSDHSTVIIEWSRLPTTSHSKSTIRVRKELNDDPG
jgi:hypothetical protein